MSCAFTCDACKKSADAPYRFGKFQHPEGWFTKAGDKRDSGFIACCQQCASKIDARQAKPRTLAKAA